MVWGLSKGILRVACAIILLNAVLTATYASDMFTVYPQTSISSVSSSSLPTNGAVSIAFDDGLQSQYDYAWPLLKAKGMTATFYVITDDVGTSGFLTVSELQNLQSNGCEIASHSKTHPSFLYISDAQIQQECSVSKQVLESYGLTINNFAYPYGECNDHTDSIVSQYYRSARAAYSHPSYIMQLPTTQFRLLATGGNIQTPITDLQDYVNNVIASKGWAIIVFHDVVPSPGDWQTSTQVFSQFLDYLVANRIQVLTVNQALDIGSRDVAVIGVVPSTVQALAGTVVNINVTVKDEGVMAGTFNVTTYYNSSTIGTQTVTNLPPGATQTLTFHWSTGGLHSGNYSIKAIASTVPGETDTADNVYVDGTVMILNPPIAKFTYSPSNPQTNKTVLFNASASSTPNGGTIINYKWNFGDGNTTSVQYPTINHSYRIAGSYKVTLTITDSKGLTASTQKTIQIRVVRFRF